MSGPSDNDDSDQEMLEFTDDEETEDEIEDEGFLHPPIDNPVDEQSSRLAEASFGGGFGLVETNQEAGTVAQDQTIGSDDIPPEFQGFENQMGSDSRPDELLDVDAGKENESSLVKLENGIGVLVEDAKAVNSEDDHLMAVSSKQERTGGELPVNVEGSSQSHTLGTNFLEGDDSGNEEEQSEFMKELENFHKERSLEFKPPRFYGEGLNCLKLWRAVAKLGGYEQVTSCKLWRQVGETFKPPKTCTTVSWTFRIFYEKALHEYEKHKIQIGELNVPVPSVPESVVVEKKVSGNPTPGTGRARRDAAARAMQGWHSHRFLSSEAGGPVIKDKNLLSLLKRDKHLKSIGALKRKKASSMERSAKIAHSKSFRPQGESMVVDVGEPADWVKINVRRTKDCFEVYALVPGLLREEVHVQSDPGGRLIISGEPEQPDNPWGVTPFKKVITLPSRIDPHQTSAVVTLHGQLFVRAPFEQSDL